MEEEVKGFGTHNRWLALRGWLRAIITRKRNVSWVASKHSGQFTWHVVTWEKKDDTR